MDKAKWISTIEKACQHYVLWTSILMLTFIVLSYFDIIEMLSTTFPDVARILNHLMGWLFFFGMFNITICGVSGVGMLFTKGTRKIGVVAIIAAVSFCFILHNIGDSF